MIGAALVVVGLVAAYWGMSTALRASRPRSLGGAIVGAAGLLLAFVGAARVAARGFSF